MMRALLLMLALAISGAPQAASLKIATLAPDGSTWMREMRAAGERIEAATDGRVRVRLYPGGVMGNDTTVLRKIRLGQLHGGAFTGSELSVVHGDSQVYSVPFLFSSYEEVEAVRTKVDPMLERGFAAAGFEIVGITGVGFAYMMSVREVRTRQDLRAAKVWVPQSDTIAERTFALAGVKPIPLALADAFTGLQTGLIDTVASTPAGAIALQWHTRIRHVFDFPVSYVVGYVALDARALARLSEADRSAVRDAFALAAANIDASNRRDNAQALAALQGQGIRVHQPTPAEVRDWGALGERILEVLVDEGTFTPEVIGSIRAELAEIRQSSAP